MIQRQCDAHRDYAGNFSQYLSYKQSGIEWLGHIPANWYLKKLCRITHCLDGRRIPLNAEQRAEKQGQYPYWGANSIVDYLDDWIFDEELVLIGEDGAPFFDKNRTVAFRVTGKIWVNNHAHVLSPDNGQIDARFLANALNCVDYRSFIDGSTRDKLTQRDLNAIPIQCPSLPEQRAIADFLEHETARIDALTAKKERLIELLHEKRDALITRAVTRGLNPDVPTKESGVEWIDEIPAHWEIKRLKFAVTLNPAPIETRNLDDSIEVSFVPMETVGEYGGLELTTTKSLGDVYNGYTYFREGDVLVAKITPCFENGKGAVASGLVNEIAFGTTELHVLRTKETLDRNFLFYLSIGDTFRRLGAAEMYGTAGQKRLPESYILNLVHPLPTLPEQRAIVDFLDRETAKIDTLVAKVREAIDHLKELRQALIAAAVTGKIDVRNLS